jgi:phosphate starvation-inducible protein PhoH
MILPIGNTIGFRPGFLTAKVLPKKREIKILEEGAISSKRIN